MLLLRPVFRWGGTFLSAVTLACSVQAIKGHDVKSPLAMAAVAAGAGGEGRLGRVALGFLLHGAFSPLRLGIIPHPWGIFFGGAFGRVHAASICTAVFFQTGYGV